MTHAVSPEALKDVAAPTPARPLGEVGEAGGKDALVALEAAVRELKAMAVAPILHRAIQALNREDFLAGGNLALEALERDERSGLGWYLLGIARERAGDFSSSVRAYEAALKLLPNHAEVANDLGRLAMRMGLHEQAEKLFRHYIDHAPHRAEGYNNLASVLKDSGRREEAIDILKAALEHHPASSMLWNTLGTLMIDVGDPDNAITFLTEAVRLDPKFGKARYNLGQAKLSLGDPAGALADCDAAMKRRLTADDRESMRFARATYLLALGRVGEGWDAYETRLSPQFVDLTHFLIEAPKWEPGADIAGKSFLVCAEQGLGDEVLFSNVLPDVVERLGPEGRLTLAVERRLVPLYERSFPKAKVMPHKTYVLATRPARVIPDLDEASIELWAPIASLLREHRRSHADFPDRVGYLKADPARVAHWKGLLADLPGPKVGLLWKSLINKDHRDRFFSPFRQWEPVLKTPGVTFVNLQYGDCSAEIAQAKAELGIDIWSPPGIDLKMDLDDVAALCVATDLMIGFSNATFNIGAACGARGWLISTPGSWPRLGLTDSYAWYPQTRVFTPQVPGDWDGVMATIAGELASFAKA
jgi:tetratricopeptide (TPR) repeat protein